MVCLRDMLVSIYRDGDSFVINASTAFRCSDDAMREVINCGGPPLPPLHSAYLAAFLTHFYPFVDGDAKIMSMGLLKSQGSSKGDVIQRATGWSQSDLQGIALPPAFWDAVRSWRPLGGDDHLPEVSAPPQQHQPLAPAEDPPPPAPHLRQGLATDTQVPTVLPSKRSAGQTNVTAQRRRTDKATVERAVARELIRHGYVQDANKHPQWKLVLQLGAQFHVTALAKEPRLDYKRRLLREMAAAQPGDTPLASAPAVQPSAPAVQPSAAASSAQSAASGNIPFRLPADEALPDGWRERIPSEEDLMKLSQRELRARILTLYRESAVRKEEAGVDAEEAHDQALHEP